MVSPFSEEALDILIKMKVKYFLKLLLEKLQNQVQTLDKLKKTGKTIFMSTGMSSWNEIKDALKILNKKKTIIMQCSSIYPCPASRVGLNIIGELKERFKITVGFSDHYSGAEAGIAAAALDAEVIEKHITFSKKMYGVMLLMLWNLMNLGNIFLQLRLFG